MNATPDMGEPSSLVGSPQSVFLGNFLGSHLLNIRSERFEFAYRLFALCPMASDFVYDAHGPRLQKPGASIRLLVNVTFMS